MQNVKQMQPMGNELVECAKHGVHMELTIPSNIHHVTPQISSQQIVVNTHNGGNNNKATQILMKLSQHNSSGDL
jgi:hypothetical protein